MRNLDFKWPGSIFGQKLTSIFIWRKRAKRISRMERNAVKTNFALKAIRESFHGNMWKHFFSTLSLSPFSIFFSFSFTFFSLYYEAIRAICTFFYYYWCVRQRLYVLCLVLLCWMVDIAAGMCFRFGISSCQQFKTFQFGIFFSSWNIFLGFVCMYYYYFFLFFIVVIYIYLVFFVWVWKTTCT